MLDITHGSPLYRTQRQARGRRRGDRLRLSFAALVRLIALWTDRVRQRRVLARLDDRLLSDIGITRTEAERECEKPFWR